MGCQEREGDGADDKGIEGEREIRRVPSTLYVFSGLLSLAAKVDDDVVRDPRHLFDDASPNVYARPPEMTETRNGLEILESESARGRDLIDAATR